MNYDDHNFIEITQQTKLRVVPVELVVSSESSCAVRQCRHSQNAWARHVERVESSRVVSSRAKWNLGFIIWRKITDLTGMLCYNFLWIFVRCLCFSCHPVCWNYQTVKDAEMGRNMTMTTGSIKNDATTSFCMNFSGCIGHVTIDGGPKIGFWEFENCQYLMELRRIQNVCHFWATLYSHMSYVKLAKFLGQPVFSWMLTIASCLAVGLWLGLVLNLVSGWLVAIHTYLYHFPLLLSVFRDSKQV